MFHPDDVIGHYILLREIGRGAFGVVWLAEKRTALTTTKFALKLPREDVIDLEAIKQEATVWEQASGHPNILPIIEADVYNDQVVIVSEYAPDGSLEKWLREHGGKAPSIEVAVDLVAGILAGLKHLHTRPRPIIHRDLKPDNILLQGETPRLADFGIARVLKTTSQTATASGTLPYMAPEAFDGKRTVQTDVWSAGVILYQLLTGRLPFPQSEITSLVGAIITREPEPLGSSVPRPLQEVVARALKKSPENRYKSAAEMRQALRDAQKDEAQALKPTVRLQAPDLLQRADAGAAKGLKKASSGRSESRPQKFWIAASVVLLLALAGGLFALMRWPPGAARNNPIDHTTTTTANGPEITNTTVTSSSSTATSSPAPVIIHQTPTPQSQPSQSTTTATIGDAPPSNNATPASSSPSGGLDTSRLDKKIEQAEAKAKVPNASRADKLAAAAAYLERANVLFNAGNPSLYKFALRDFRRTLRYDPNNSEARAKQDQIVQIYQQMGRPVPDLGNGP